MIGMLILLCAAILLLRAGFGLLALVMKAFGLLLGLMFGGLAAVAAIGFTVLLGGALGLGLMLLLAAVTFPLWFPLLVAIAILRLLLRSNQPALI
jgi:hypothetical protein